MLQKYGDFSPTCFDPEGAFLDDDRQDWLLAPVSRTRDSGVLANSNFETMKKILIDIDPEMYDHEQHCFGHWGPGWFEIILVRPDSPCHHQCEETLQALEDYPVLDEMDLSEREWEEACTAWENLSVGDRLEICQRHGISPFASRHDTIPRGLPHYEDFYILGE